MHAAKMETSTKVTDVQTNGSLHFLGITSITLQKLCKHWGYNDRHWFSCGFSLQYMGPRLYHRSDYDLLGFRFQGKYYFDKMVPFELSTSCAFYLTSFVIFPKVAQLSCELTEEQKIDIWPLQTPVAEGMDFYMAKVASKRGLKAGGLCEEGKRVRTGYNQLQT